jgi:hypothetical protein
MPVRFRVDPTVTRQASHRPGRAPCTPPVPQSRAPRHDVRTALCCPATRVSGDARCGVVAAATWGAAGRTAPLGSRAAGCAASAKSATPCPPTRSALRASRRCHGCRRTATVPAASEPASGAAPVAGRAEACGTPATPRSSPGAGASWRFPAGFPSLPAALASPTG